MKTIEGGMVLLLLAAVYAISYIVCAIILAAENKNASSDPSVNRYGIEKNGHDKKYIKVSAVMFLIGGVCALWVRFNESNINFKPDQDAWIYLCCLGTALFGVYMLPSLVARKNNHESTRTIVWLNYLFGATIIIYIVLVIWASKKPASPAVIVNQTSDADDLKKFKELLDSGAITQEEYEAKKKQILNI